MYRHIVLRLLAVLIPVAAAIGVGPAWATSATRSSGFAYDASSGLLTQEVIEPNMSALRMQTSYGYDAFGNKISTTISGADVATRTATSTYDARGQFLTGMANSLGHKESWQYDPRFGQAVSHTGPNGLTTTWQYDGFGRKVAEVRPDGTRTRWDYLYCSGVNGGTATCPANGAYLVKATPLAADGVTQNGPVSSNYHDNLGRVIASDSQGFDGATIRQETRYDAFGRVGQVSRPYFLTGGTPRWMVRSYDALGRPLTETAPDNSQTRFGYSGLTTTVTNALNQTTTTTRNNQGQVASVTDALGNTTSYLYDPFDNLLRLTDPAGNVTTYSYDTRGRKIAMADPDMGSWSYSYNVLGELIGQTDAKGQTSSLSYDKLGRLIQRTEPDLISTWTYDTAAKGIGKLAETATSGGYKRAYAYDSLGRPAQTTTTVDGAAYTTATTYDANSRIATARYASGFTVRYVYTALGHLQKLTDAATGKTYWTANSRDAEWRLTQQTAGNGIVTTQSFDPATGLVQSINAGDGAVSNLTFGFDALANLKSRNDANARVTDSFVYDGLNRLTEYATTAQRQYDGVVVYDVRRYVTYDALGNIVTKSDAGMYSYAAAGSPQPHAVKSVYGGALSTAFSYDANGNMTAGAGGNLTYTSFNMPAAIKQGSTQTDFTYDSDHKRLKQTTDQATTLYLTDPVAGLRSEKVGQQWNDFLVAGDVLIGERFRSSSGFVTLRYFHADHLGSVVALTDENGTVVERLSYDAWGKRRNVNGTDDPAGGLSSQTNRGFTGHEMLDGVDLVHMNARLYDPLVGRFLSADPYIQAPHNSQSLNRYTYVFDNPLSYTDPTGYWSLRGLFNNPFVRGIVAVAAAVTLQVYALPALYGAMGFSAAAVPGAITAGISAAAAGAIATGTLKGAAIGGIAGGLFYGAGSLVKDSGLTGGNALALRVGLHGTVGGTISIMQGGQFGSGFLAAGFASGAGGALERLKLGFVGQVTAHAIVGGGGSVLGGGKFENGAVTGAFGYLFNETAGGGGRGSGPTLQKGTGGVAFVGGFFDYTIDGPVYRSYLDYTQGGDSAAYFTWDQGGALGSWIDANGVGVDVRAHSYGGDTAASVVAAGHHVNSLTTIDPVSWFRPNFAAVAANAGSWTNLVATGSQSWFNNAVAAVGGKWGAVPGAANRNVPDDHGTIGYCALGANRC